MIIKAVGDIAGGDAVIDGLGVASVAIRRGNGYLFKELNGLLAGANLLLGNLEGPLSEKRLSQPMRLCGVPDLAQALRAVGFDVLSVANNHVLDHGTAVFRETIDCCLAAGIEICGLRGSGKYYSEPVINEVEGVKIGILAYNWIGVDELKDTKESQCIATIHDSVVNYTWNRDHDADMQARNNILRKNQHVLSDIANLKKDVDYVILMPHWGYEWVNSPPYGVVLEAHTFINAGADVIFGSHPHVVQGIEYYNNKLIAYSLGNFLFDSSSSKSDSGMVLNVSLGAEKRNRHEINHLCWSSSFQPMPVNEKFSNKQDKILEESNRQIVSSDNEVVLEDDTLYREFEKQYNRLKIATVWYFLRKLPTTPSLVIPISRKVVSLVEILLLRLRGQKVRW